MNEVAKAMKLQDTVDMMVSGDYRERIEAEYYQLAIRYNRLKLMLDKWDKGELDFVPKSPKYLCKVQLSVMEDYLKVMKDMAKFENVEIC